MRLLFPIFFIVFCCVGCRGPLPRGGERVGRIGDEKLLGALVPVPSSQIPSFFDDGDRAGLINAAKQSAAYFRALPIGRKFILGPDSYSAKEMAESLAFFIKVMESDRADVNEVLRRDFVVYASVGSDGEGTVVFSSYYEHSLRASLERTSRFRFPLYGRPADLEEITENGERKVRRRGRPYYTREEIDSKNVLSGRGLEIAWADNPVDIFFLQVQGSGWLLLPNGEQLRVRYAANNGHPFKSVG